jgi:nitrate reductase gamma subunit
MSTVDIFLWMVVPYVAIAVFLVGHIWRYRREVAAHQGGGRTSAAHPRAALSASARPDAIRGLRR